MVVIPATVREQIAAHARDEAPNECCGLVLLDRDVGLEYVRAVNKTASPYRFELYLDPIRWADLGDTHLDQGIVHSHPASPPRPSRTDVENIGLWQGRPYLIYSLRDDDLAAWTIQDGQIAPLDLVSR